MAQPTDGLSHQALGADGAASIGKGHADPGVASIGGAVSGFMQHGLEPGQPAQAGGLVDHSIPLQGTEHAHGAIALAKHQHERLFIAELFSPA